MKLDSPRLALIFSAVGHAYIHLFIAFYFTIVLALEVAWQKPFDHLLDLWMPGAILVGAAALPAGWLADRWSVAGMMVVFFAGMGASSILAGLVGGPGGMLLALAGIGTFAAIYHPVGIPWVIRNARRRAGKVLAINGIFGGIGVGMAALVAGNLIDWFGWRWAFILPGAICLATGGVLFLLLSSGRIVEVSRVARDTASVSREARVRAFGILLVTMLISGIVFHATQAAMPKMFDLRLGAILGEGKSGVGILVAAVYFVGAFAQLAGGYMADRWPLKTVYLLSWGAQIPFLWLVAVLGGPLLALVAVLMVSLNSASLPAENLLLSRFTPARHHGLAFGLKFVLAFGAGPLAIQLVARLQSATGEFLLLFQTLTAGAVVVTVVALMLPRGVGAARTAAVSAE